MSVRISRRQALVGFGALSVGGFGLLGRFALGDSFERHTAELLGLDLQVVRDLLGALREEQGGSEYDLRAAGFVAATSTPARLAMPGSARREAVESFVGPLLDLSDGLLTPYVLAGIQQSGSGGPCGGRMRS